MKIDVAYSRVMFLGAAGVGKTSLKRALMKQPWEAGANSTIIADVRQVKYGWMGGGQQWIEMMHEDEIDELAKLLAAVDNSSDTKTLLCSTLNSSIISSPLKETDETSLCNMSKDYERTAVNPTISEAILRSEKISPEDVSSLSVQPFLHVWDCGGQPVFLETLPAFITSRTMFILVFDASKDFTSNWRSVQYQEGIEVVGEEMNITVLDLLLQWMANIYAHLAKRDEQGALLDYPRILVVGTHGDQLTSEEKLSKREQFLSHCKGKACTELLQDFLIVDNTLARRSDEEGEDPDFNTIRDAINSFTTTKLVINTHVSWVLFRKVVQGLGRNVISLEEAHAIAVACKIPIASVNLLNVLNFYHELGVILFYPYIDGLKQNVIVNPKWFLATLGKVLTLKGREEYKTGHMWDVLREYGVLVQPLYIGAWKNCEGVDPEAVMDLLVHLRLAAPVKTKVYHDYDVKQYFIPAVLPISGDLHTIPTSGFRERATALHITFSTKFVPPGFFTRFAATLLESPMCEILFQKGVYRNRLTFCYGEPPLDHVILTDLSNVVEVVVLRFVPASGSIAPLDKVCGKLLDFLNKCCKEVSDIVCSRRIPYELRFICNSDECRQKGHGLHYLIHPSTGQTKDLPLQCEKNDTFRLPEPAESYWFLASTKTEVITMYICKMSCNFLFF